MGDASRLCRVSFVSLRVAVDSVVVPRCKLTSCSPGGESEDGVPAVTVCSARSCRYLVVDAGFAELIDQVNITLFALPFVPA